MAQGIPGLPPMLQGTRSFAVFFDAQGDKINPFILIGPPAGNLNLQGQMNLYQGAAGIPPYLTPRRPPGRNNDWTQ